jgi:hypothetical protein
VADEVALLAAGLDEKFQSKVALILKPPRSHRDPAVESGRSENGK